MKARLYITLLLFAGLTLNIGVHAQVKIGDTTQPSDFSTLELDTKYVKGGFRIPQLDEAATAKLTTYLLGLSGAEKKAANGLVIYNTTKRNLYYWDGENWANSESLNMLAGENGVSLIDPVTPGTVNFSGGLKLGGAMSDKYNTEIKINDKSLHFPFNEDAASSDRFKIANTATGENVLNIKKDKIGIGGTADPASPLVIDNSTGKHAQTLRISNSEEKEGYLLVSSNYKGDALWRPIRPLSKVDRGVIKNGVAVKNASGKDVSIVDGNNAGYLALTEGQWLIVAKAAVKIASGGSNGQYLAYLKLKSSSIPNPAPDSDGGFAVANPYFTLRTITSALPSQQVLRDNSYYAMPQLFYYASVTKKVEYFHLHMSSSRAFSTTGDYGRNDFYALRIDNIRTVVATDGSIVCKSVPSLIELKTGESITGAHQGNVDISVSDGLIFLYAQGSTLEDPDDIGSAMGINLDVIGTGTTAEEIAGKYYEISPGSDNTRNVKFNVSGTLDDGVKSGYHTVPVEIVGAKLVGAACGVSIFVPTEGRLICDNLAFSEATEADRLVSQGKTHRGRGKKVLFTTGMELEMTSGSVDITKDQVLNEKYGVQLKSARETYSYLARRTFDLPITVEGTVAADAPGGVFELIPSLGTVPHGTVTSCSSGVKIHIVIAQVECSNAEYPSNAKINLKHPLRIVVDNESDDTFILKSGTVLGTGTGSSSDIKVTYAGANRTLTRGLHTLEDVHIVSGNNKNQGTYTVSLNALDLYGIASCDLVINVIDYGNYKPASVEVLASEAPISTEIIVPIEWQSNTITIKEGDILGEVTNGGKSYNVKAAESIVINSAATAASGIKCLLSGSADTVGGTSYVIPLNKTVGVSSANVTLKVNPIPETGG